MTANYLLSVVVSMMIIGFTPIFSDDQLSSGEARNQEIPSYRERLDDPPADTDVSKVTLDGGSMNIERNGFTSVQVNVDVGGMNILNDAANEPSIAVNPLNSENIVMAWRQFDSITSNFRQSGVAYSFDAGASWTFPGPVVPGIFYSDPVLRANAEGEFFYAGISQRPFDETGTLGLYSDVFRSTNGGISWDGPFEADGGDKHWFAIDRTGGIGHGNRYLLGTEEIDRDCSVFPLGSVVPGTSTCSNGNDVIMKCFPGECCLYWPHRNEDVCCSQRVFSRAVGEELTFEPRVELYDPEQPVPVLDHFWNYPFNRQIVIGNNGEVFTGGTTAKNPLVAGPEEDTYCISSEFRRASIVYRSSDAKNPGLRPTFDDSEVPLLGVPGSSSRPGTRPNPGGFYGDLVLQVDRSVGPRRGFLYALAAVDDPSSDPRDVRFSRSEDGGVTWSPSIRINDDPEDNGAWQWFGTMSVAPNGRIDAVWNDTRNSGGNPRLSELFYSYSTDGGESWVDNLPVSPQWDSHLGWPNQSKIGDYYDMESDLYGSNIAYAATFGGEQNVYYLRLYPDCNNNSQSDVLDIETFLSSDIDGDSSPDECSGLVLVDSSDSSSNKLGFEVGGGTPGGKVTVFFSDQTGTSTIAACPSIPTGLSSPKKLGSRHAPVLVEGGLSSSVRLTTRVPRVRGQDHIFVQAVDETSCRMSAVLSVQVP